MSILRSKGLRLQFTDRGHLASAPLVVRPFRIGAPAVVLARPVFVIESNDVGVCEECQGTGDRGGLSGANCDACLGTGEGEPEWTVSARCSGLAPHAAAVVDDVQSVCGSSLDGRRDPDGFVYTIISGEGADDEAREELRAAGYRVEVRSSS